MADKRDYCRLCLIKYDPGYLITLFGRAANTKAGQLDHQIKTVLSSLQISAGDGFSRKICTECARRTATAYDFISFCVDNQKLLASNSFNEDLLLGSTRGEPEPITIDDEDNSTGNGIPERQDVAKQPPIQPSAPVASVQRTISNDPADSDLSILSLPAANEDFIAWMAKQNGRRNGTAERGNINPNYILEGKDANDATQDKRSDIADSNDDDEDDDDDENVMAIVECQLNEDENSQPLNSLNASNEQNSSARLSAYMGEKGSTPYKCSVCYRGFGKRANVLSHFQTQHSSLELPSKWKYHIERTACPLCGESVECLAAHLEHHSGKRPFKCNFCECAFLTRNYVNIHIAKLHRADEQIDSKADRFACKLCPGLPPLAYENYGQLIEHYRGQHTHEIKNSLELCTLCGKQTRYLSLHLMKFHSKECPFKCHLCDKSYTKARYLLTHLTTMHPNAPKPLAAVKPEPKSSHEEGAITGESVLLPCLNCHMFFPSKRLLKMHIKRYHQEPTAAEVQKEQPGRVRTMTKDGVNYSHNNNHNHHHNHNNPINNNNNNNINNQHHKSHSNNSNNNTPNNSAIDATEPAKKRVSFNLPANNENAPFQEIFETFYRYDDVI